MALEIGGVWPVQLEGAAPTIGGVMTIISGLAAGALSGGWFASSTGAIRARGRPVQQFVKTRATPP